MACRHAGEKLDFGTKCKIMDKRCGLLCPDENRCSEQNGAIINYLKVIGTYDEKVKNNPKYISDMMHSEERDDMNGRIT